MTRISEKWNKDNCNNLRGIILLETRCKVYTNIVTYLAGAVAQAVLPGEQNGFEKDIQQQILFL
jgi:hypothetical protein